MKTLEQIKDKIESATFELADELHNAVIDAFDEGKTEDKKKGHTEGFDEGHREGYEAGLEEVDDNYREKIGVEYAVEAFKDCTTLEDFQDKHRELTNLSCTFMPTLGLKR